MRYEVKFVLSLFKMKDYEEHIREPIGQAKKSARGMPWHWEPTKDAASCEKPRGAASRRYIRGFPNGAIH